MKNSVKKKPVQKSTSDQSVCPEQTTPATSSDTAVFDKSYDFLVSQLDYVTLFRTETFRRLSLALAFSSFIFYLLVSETTYVYTNNLYDRLIIIISLVAFLIFTIILILTAYFLSSMVMDKASLMIPSRILGEGIKDYKGIKEYEARVHSEPVGEYKKILIQEIYAVSRAEKRRSRILNWILRALVVLYTLVLVNALMVAYVQKFGPK